MTHAALVERLRDQMERFSAPPKPKPVRDSLSRFFRLQTERARDKGNSIVARYRRRVKELEPAPHVETRGSRQTWHRDTPRQEADVEW